MNNVFIFKLIEDTVAPKNDKVVGILINFEEANIRLSNHNFGISEQWWDFRFNIAKSPANTQSTWKNSMWSQYNLSLSTLTHDRCILVNLATTLKNSLHFNRVCWLMIIWKRENLFASINRQHSPTITCVCYITNIINNECDNCARSRSFNITYLLLLANCKLNKQLFSLSKPVSNCLNRFFWEAVIFDDLLSRS